MYSEKTIHAVDELDLLMDKVSRVHGNEHPELKEIKECYIEIKKAISDSNNEGVSIALKAAAALSNSFTLPSDACPAYERVFKAYKDLTEEFC